MNGVIKILKFMFLFIIIGTVLYITDVKAYNLIELDNYGVSCLYKNETNDLYSFTILVNYDTQIWEIDATEESFEKINICVECGRPENAMSMVDESTINWFKEKEILTIPSNKKSYHWTCPSKPFGAEGLTLIEQGCNKKNCSTDIIPSFEDLHPPYTCNYKSVTSKDLLKIDYSYNSNNGHTWLVTYPDGITKTYNLTESRGNFMPTSDCEDIYYIEKDRKITAAIEASVSNNAALDKLCLSHNEDEIKHFCVGYCSYGSVKCPEIVDDTSCPEEIKPIIKFIKIGVINMIQIFVPILLIVMGTIDFFKAVISFDDKVNKEAVSKFIRRCLSAIALFFIVTIVTIIMDMFTKTELGEQSDWKSCWQSVD